MDRKSLVIGIGDYNHFSSLDNCVNDATDIHSFLVENGFDSTLIINAKQKNLVASIAKFKDSIAENTISVIFFAGHGLQDDKHNFLVAADSEVKSTIDIKYNCVYADDLFITESKANLHLIILDACRNNPFKDGNRGITVGLSKMHAPAGTLIAFSTSPNSASLERAGERNGIYTKHLLNNIQTPNLPVELVFKNTRNDVILDTKQRQVPWEESSLYGDHFSFINAKQDVIESFVAEVIESDRKIGLVELMPFLNVSNFTNLSINQLLMILALVRISFGMEEEKEHSMTVDHDYLDNLLFTTYFPLFDERLFKEDKATEPFSLDLFNQITIKRGRNFGYNSLEGPDESFSQFMMNIVKWYGDDALLLLYLSVKDDQHVLKPTIITSKNGNLIIHNYAQVIGDKVKEIFEPYLKMREPFEKKTPDLFSDMTIEQIDD
ncbi:caspase family protein [Algoriphagus pacificus]|uniref:Caspase family protein n=1 Tax=Algoriphagus pacificus TaxID=2811234 RepID=A0ABS3CLU1_9BACT|nr:caspase family protein [Algoriphagus pacificus]MBN7818067.1 caspase family protein [Algoriphagus pacificus]